MSETIKAMEEEPINAGMEDEAIEAMEDEAMQKEAAEERAKNVVYIPAEELSPHPKNPRAELGDLSELTESIRENGVLQNLTVVPVDGKPWKYLILIGHRRYAAGVIAGLREFPCRIKEGLSESEQVSIMLQENMQRSDLNVWEQARGFQMMLDLGETADTIAKKTGFSKTTVRHRLNIAKLNQDTLLEKVKDPEFQLTISNIVALEKVHDVEKRDEILRKATNSQNLLWMVEAAVITESIEKRKAEVIEKLEAAGIKEITAEEQKLRREMVSFFDLNFGVPEFDPSDWTDCVYWYNFRKIYVYRLVEDGIPDDPDSEDDPEKEKYNKLYALCEEMSAQRHDFVTRFVDGQIAPIRDREKMDQLMASLWKILLNSYGSNSADEITAYLTGVPYWKMTPEEKEEGRTKAEAMDVFTGMLVLAARRADSKPIQMNDRYRCSYSESSGKWLMAFTEVLAEFGFVYSSEEMYAVMEGSHELFAKPEEMEA